MVIIAFLALLLETSANACIARLSEELTYQLRYEIFRKILYLPISWHDEPEHTPAIITACLASEV
jgi:ABC-type bacteriocin/lantibiotic exporter with double-glycine peptidase domain